MKKQQQSQLVTNFADLCLDLLWKISLVPTAIASNVQSTNAYYNNLLFHHENEQIDHEAQQLWGIWMKQISLCGYLDLYVYIPTYHLTGGIFLFDTFLYSLDKKWDWCDISQLKFLDSKRDRS